MNQTLAAQPAGPDRRVFQATQRVGLQAAGFLAGGTLFLLMLLLQFILMLGAKTVSPERERLMPGMIGGLSVIGIGLIARGVFLLRSVVRVVTDPAGVHVQGFISRQSFAWEQIDRIQRDKKTQLIGGKTNDVLVLLRRHGHSDRTLAVIPDTIDNFEALAAELAERSAVAHGGASTYNPERDQKVRVEKEAKQLKFARVFLIIFTLLFATMFCYGLYEEMHERKLTSSGTPVEARIDKRFMRAVTPYIAYSFEDARGATHSREVMVTQQLYDQTDGANTVRVVYLADQPTWNRLATGDESTHFGGSFLLIIGLGTLMFGAFAVMTMLGIDLKSENGQMILTRSGQVIRTLGENKRPSAGFEVPSPERFQSAFTKPLPPGAMAPPQPPPYEMAPARPRGLIALGVICIVLGLLGALMGLVRWLLLAGPRTLNAGDEVIIIDPQPWMRWWNLADAILAALLIVTGIGLLMMQRWSRPLGIAVAALQILSSLGSIATTIHSLATLPEATGPDSMPMRAAGVGAIFFQMLTMVFPAVLLVILAKRSTAETLNRDIS